ncbi:MAG: cytochrome c peroxidase [Bacteroidota bacterium]|nr:cytochrome c peroxidase [Bacteroidota bacterium]
MQFRILYTYILLLLMAGIMISACQNTETDHRESPGKKAVLYLGRIDALPVTYKSPADNPSSPEKIELGRLLFYDPILSGGKDVACASCHHPEFGYAESLDLSIGVNGTGLGEKRKFNSNNDIPFTKRNAQSLLNTAFNGINEDGDYSPEHAPMFWDLRASSLEEQAFMPVKTMEEMRGHGFSEENIDGEIVRRINHIPRYRDLFKHVFENEDSAVTDKNISKALAAFERSLLANNSSFDKFMRGDESAYSSSEKDGMQLFISTGCARCHNGPMLSDFKTHVLGVADNEKRPQSDSGYHGTYAFRTPSLRNLRFTRPFMHDGKLQTLEDVLSFYEDLHGKDIPNHHVKREQVDSLALMMTVDFKNINAIVEFLNTLNDGDYDKKIPASVPSGLPVGGKIK